ncbi:hypothetical protein NE237_003065 [Protea cynaroides]|uniref:Uncharacterized protein n=1 Tax=Protea cynaroides TaxID=273540 RepID=A0A9Q0KGP7_9MAGN|nr:hypothetical protein NE237_003065 [Protea cynaroides]
MGIKVSWVQRSAGGDTVVPPDMEVNLGGSVGIQATITGMTGVVTPSSHVGDSFSVLKSTDPSVVLMAGRSQSAEDVIRSLDLVVFATKDLVVLATKSSGACSEVNACVITCGNNCYFG